MKPSAWNGILVLGLTPILGVIHYFAWHSSIPEEVWSGKESPRSWVTTVLELPLGLIHRERPWDNVWMLNSVLVGFAVALLFVRFVRRRSRRDPRRPSCVVVGAQRGVAR